MWKSIADTHVDIAYEKFRRYLRQYSKSNNTGTEIIATLWTSSKSSEQSMPAPLINSDTPPGWNSVYWVTLYTLPTTPQQRIIYRLCLFMHYIHIGQAPKYLSDCVSTVSAASGRYRLRSTGSAAYFLPRTRTKFGKRGFFYSGPAAWNTLPSDLHDITDTSTSRKRLKNVLFDRDYCWCSWTSRI